MKALRVSALIASVLCLAVLVSPAVASGPVLSSAAAPAADVPSITATGVGFAQSSAYDPFALGQTLYISVQSTADAAGIQDTADQMLARLDAIRAALVKVGVPADGIRMAGIGVNPVYGPAKPSASPVDKAEAQKQQVATSLTFAASLTADVPSIRLLLAAMNAATQNGATTVNANSGKGSTPYGSAQPSAADLTKATQAAVANARTNAEALASASGKKLGAIRAISSSQPPMNSCCPANSGWTVQLMVTFEIAQ